MSDRYLKKVLQPYKKSFNDTENKIASHFIEVNQDLINKSITQLSEEIGVSESTIFKFVKKIGYQGFRHFKISFASNYNPKEESTNKINVFSDINEKDSLDNIFQKVIVPKIGLLEYLLEELDTKLIEEAVELIHQSEMLFFGGIGGSSVIAYDSYHKFLRTEYQSHYIADFKMQLTYAKKMDNKSLAFLFSHSGTSKEIIELGNILKENDVKIISLTGNHGTALEELSDVSFVISSEESALRSETLSSRILYMTIIDILYVIIMYRDSKYNAKSLDINLD